MPICTTSTRRRDHVVLNIGGYRYRVSVNAASPAAHFDAYFSSRYARDVCADGSIFIDRDGESISVRCCGICVTACRRWSRMRRRWTRRCFAM
jgi:hypothetical protein